eukprot:Clim_evm41s146 gene=Clim_evmTU41s146
MEKDRVIAVSASLKDHIDLTQTYWTTLADSPAAIDRFQTPSKGSPKLKSKKRTPKKGTPKKSSSALERNRAFEVWREVVLGCDSVDKQVNLLYRSYIKFEGNVPTRLLIGEGLVNVCDISPKFAPLKDRILRCLASDWRTVGGLQRSCQLLYLCLSRLLNQDTIDKMNNVKNATKLAEGCEKNVKRVSGRTKASAEDLVQSAFPVLKELWEVERDPRQIISLCYWAIALLGLSENPEEKRRDYLQDCHKKVLSTCGETSEQSLLHFAVPSMAWLATHDVLDAHLAKQAINAAVRSSDEVLLHNILVVCGDDLQNEYATLLATKGGLWYIETLGAVSGTQLDPGMAQHVATYI